MKTFTVYVSETRSICHEYSVKAESFEAVNKMKVADIEQIGEYIEVAGESTEESLVMEIIEDET